MAFGHCRRGDVFRGVALQPGDVSLSRRGGGRTDGNDDPDGQRHAARADGVGADESAALRHADRARRLRRARSSLTAQFRHFDRHCAVWLRRRPRRRVRAARRRIRDRQAHPVAAADCTAARRRSVVASGAVFRGVSPRSQTGADLRRQHRHGTVGGRDGMDSRLARGPCRRCRRERDPDDCNIHLDRRDLVALPRAMACTGRGATRMTRPTVTVAIPNYNHGRYIADALQSVLSQSLPPHEVIVIDDCSKDDSVDVVNGFVREHPNVRLIRNEVNRGVFYGVARALEEATGDYFYLLAADDKVLPGFFERTVSMLEQHSGAGMCATALEYFDAHGGDLRRDRQPFFHTHAAHAKGSSVFLSGEDVLQRLEAQPWFLGGIAAVMFRRSAFAEAGGLRGELGLFADWYLPHYVGLKHGMCYVPEALAAFRIQASSYGTDIALRPRAFFENANATLRLLTESQNADVFSPEFVQKARKNFTYAAFRGAVANWQTTFLADMEELLPPRGIVARILFKLLRGVRILQWALVKAYCFRRTAPALLRQ